MTLDRRLKKPFVSHFDTVGFSSLVASQIPSLKFSAFSFGLGIVDKLFTGSKAMLRKVLPIAVIGVLLSGVIVSPVLAMGKVTGSKNPEGKKGEEAADREGDSKIQAQSTLGSSSLQEGGLTMSLEVVTGEGLGSMTGGPQNLFGIIQSINDNLLETLLPQPSGQPKLKVLTTPLNQYALPQSITGASEKSELNEFNLQDMDLSQGLGVMIEEIIKCEPVKLILKNTNLKDNDLNTLKALVTSIPGLEILDMSQNDFTTTGLKAIVSFFAGRKSPLNIMASPKNKLSPEELQDLAQHFEMKKQANELGAMAVLHLGPTTFMHAHSVISSRDNSQGLMIDSK